MAVVLAVADVGGYYAPRHPLIAPWVAGALIVALLLLAAALLADD